MRRRRFWPLCLVFAAFAAAVMALGAAQAQDTAGGGQDLEQTGPLWAYAWAHPAQPGDTHGTQPLIRDMGLRPGETMEELNKVWSFPGSDFMFTRRDLRDHDLTKSDWFPGDHPPMPDIIKIGPASLGESTGWSCGLCHLPNGKGRPENAPPAGQPVAYTMQQLRDFADGLRYTSDPRKSNTHTMVRLAQAMSEEEMLESAEYFAAIPWTPWMRVIETDLVPEMHLHENEMFLAVGTERTEPIAGRIIESPENELYANYLRNARSGWNVYVPVGKPRQGQGARDNRRRQDGGVRRMPRAESHGSRVDARHRWPIAELHDATAVGHAAGDAQWPAGGSDDADHREPDGRGHDEHRRVPGLAHAAARAGDTADGTADAGPLGRLSAMELLAWGSRPHARDRLIPLLPGLRESRRCTCGS